MKIIYSSIFIALLLACSPKKKGNMLVNGEIKGLRKGTLYLQKMKDTTLISVDSIHLLGNEKFILSDNVDSPVIYYVTFKGNKTNKKILFFGEKGTITIHDNLKEFGFQPTISGSENQKILDKFTSINRKFQEQYLNFIKKRFDALQSKNKALYQQIEKKFEKMLKKRILFTANFAISNSNYEVGTLYRINRII